MSLSELWRRGIVREGTILPPRLGRPVPWPSEAWQQSVGRWFLLGIAMAGVVASAHTSLRSLIGITNPALDLEFQHSNFST
jgi:hypothetical protein